MIINEIQLANEKEMEQFSALKDSLYPGAKDASIQMVLSYCRAANIDPMLKPVHIVPMTIEDKKTGEWQSRDVVMPGIGLYRICAARTGEYFGCSAPKFGPMIEKDFEGMKFTYPEWCKITVKRLVKGKIAKFTVQEFWIENYATAGKNTTKPNSMWRKRSRGQLAKCAKAQALRDAFPELVSSQYTAEEMEGKNLEEFRSGEILEGVAQKVESENPKNAAESLKAKLKLDKKNVESEDPISAETKKKLDLYLAYQGEEKINFIKNKAKVNDIGELTENRALKIIAYLDKEESQKQEEVGNG